MLNLCQHTCFKLVYSFYFQTDMKFANKEIDNFKICLRSLDRNNLFNLYPVIIKDISQ